MGFHIDTSRPVIEFGVLIFIAAVVIYSIILAYHWYSYGTSKQTVHRALIVYVSGLTVLIATLLMILTRSV